MPKIQNLDDAAAVIIDRPAEQATVRVAWAWHKNCAWQPA